MDRVVIIADDFTGANDTGVHFARGGVRTAFLFEKNAIPRAFDACDALALSTETRYSSARDAAGAASDFVWACQRAGGTFFYKKIDSAMRGNPDVETRAMLDRLGIPAALVCPALPALGRSVLGGILRIDGTPLRETPLGQDAFTPVDTSDVAELFTRRSGLRAGHLGIDELECDREHAVRAMRGLLDSGCSAIVADAATDAHLDVLAEILMTSRKPDGLPRLLPVGSAGLGKALARSFSGAPVREFVRPRGRLLAVVGSLNEAAAEQVDFAVENKRYESLSFSVENALEHPEHECNILLDKAAATQEHVLLRGESRERKSEMTVESGVRVAEAYGRLARALCRKLPFTTVFAAGGNVAIHVARHLGVSRMTLEEELLPGVALASCFAADTHVRGFVSKAGSFGGKETLARLADLLSTQGQDSLT